MLDKKTDFTNELANNENDLLTQKAVYEKKKQLLGMDDMTQKHTLQELEEKFCQMNDECNRNEATRSLDTKEREYQEIEHNVERSRKEANNFYTQNGKFEAERDAHSR